MLAGTHKTLKLNLLLCAALMLRALIPAGFMPVATGNGLLFDFCPESVSNEFMQLMSGDGHQHHGDGSGGDHEDHRCPLGLMLLSAVIPDDYTAPDAIPVSHALVAAQHRHFSYSHDTPYHSRAPPA